MRPIDFSTLKEADQFRDDGIGGEIVQRQVLIAAHGPVYQQNTQARDEPFELQNRASQIDPCFLKIICFTSFKNQARQTI